jgi:hypothetical protein
VLITAAVVLGVVGFIGGWSIARAEAFPINLGRPPQSDCSTNKCWDLYEEVVYWFEGSLWTSTLKTRFIDGTARWDQIDDNEGNHITTATQVASDPGNNAPNEVPVRLVPGDLVGSTDCSNYFWYQNEQSGDLAFIELKWNDNPDISLNDFEGVAHHEMGHAHGLKHVTWAESFDGDEPTMVAGRDRR